MKRLLVALALVVSFFGTAQGFEEDTILKQRDNNSLDFQKVVMEQNLRTKLQAVVGPMFQSAKYQLDVSINYKIYKGGRRAAGNEIELDKYGVIAPTISQEALQTDLVSNIGWINVKLVAYDHIPEEKIAMFEDISKKVVDMVPAWRVRVQTVNPPAAAAPAPSITVTKTLAPYFVGFFFASVFLVSVLYFFFKQLQYRRPEGNQETHVHHHAHAAPPQPQEQPFTQNTNPQHETKDVSSDASLVFEAEFREIEPDFANSPKVEVEKPKTKAAKFNAPAEVVENVFELLEASTPATEKKLFDSLAKTGKTDVLREAATAYFPSELMFNLSPEIITAALDMMPLDDRLGLILCSEAADSSVLINCLNAKARAYMELELEKNQANAAVKLEIRRNSARYRKNFATSVRQLLKSNSEFASLASPQLEEWLQRKSAGVRDVS